LFQARLLEQKRVLITQIASVKSLDLNDVHGALSALAAIAPRLTPRDPRRGKVSLQLHLILQLAAEEAAL
jgi:hypothetical protein